MNPHQLFREFVDGYGQGKQAKAARAIGRSRALVNRVYHGELPISLSVARKIEQLSDGRYGASVLLGMTPHNVEQVMREHTTPHKGEGR
jgi:hypothetical protein